MSSEVIKFVEQKLGYAPRDAKMFERAFSHSSAGPNSYDRLEFLGDRVLGLSISAALYERYPNEPEGQLSRRYNALVARETCADVGREIGIPPLIRLGKQAREDGANQSDNVVGDVVEAVIGALMLDGGFDVARDFVLRAWKPFLDGQGRAPEYSLVSRTGAHHAPVFTVKVSVKGLGEATAEGTSKQDAETAAAAELLKQLQ